MSFDKLRRRKSLGPWVTTSDEPGSASAVRHFAPRDDVTVGIHGPDQDGAHWRRTIVAGQGGRVIGRGTALLSATHRDRYRIEIDVDEGS